MKVVKNNRQIWLNFFRAAEVYRDLKPWEWMYDSDLFGVQDPVTGKIGYCCVLGNLGEHYALNVYMGPEGLSSYYEMLEFGEDDPMMAGLRQNCISVSFEDRDALSDQDRKLIKDLGLKYRGAGQWVMGREYLPGWLPWYISIEQAEYLTHALQQAVGVAMRVEEDPELLRFDEEQVLVRVPRQTPNGLQWEDQIMELPDCEYDLAIPVPDAIIEKGRQLPQTRSVLMLILSFGPQPVRDDETSGRPFFPTMAMMLDKKSKAILSFDMFAPNDMKKLPYWFVHMLEKLGERPAKIIVSNGFGAGMIEPLAEGLSIKLEVRPDDPVFQEVTEMLFQFMG